MEDIETGSESIESGVTEGSSPEASSNESDGGVQAQAQAPKQEQEIDWDKAFKHDRFKELVSSKNEALTKYQEMESRYKALEQQLTSFKDSQPKAPSETDALIADLKKVDPRLANVIEQQLKAAQATESVQKRLEAFERHSQESARQQVLSNAVSKINSLHEVNKASDFGKQFINNQLDIAYRNGSLNPADVKAVEAAYGEASKAIKSFEENLKRDITKGYVEAKSKDAAVPASVPKGAQAKPAAKNLNVPRDKDALKASVVQSFLKEQAASKEATNT